MRDEQKVESRQQKVGGKRQGVRRSAYYLLFAVVYLFLQVTSVLAQEHATTQGSFAFTGFAAFTGTRAMGFNGAFTAIADDATSPYWNSAGLAAIGYKELATSYTDLYGLGLIRSNAVALSFPDRGNGAAAINWVQLRYDLDSWREQLFMGSYAKKLIGHSAMGINVRHFRQTSGMEMGNSRGWSIDASGLAQFGRLRVGITLHDLYSHLKLGSETEEKFPFTWRAGIALLPFGRLTGALDLVGADSSLKQIHIGVEQWIGQADFTPPIHETSIGIRAGVAKSLWGKKRMTYATGISLRLDAWQLDYAYLADNEGLGETHRFALGVRF